MEHNKKPTDDPIVMYLIVRESLNMSMGKTADQVGHAVQLILQDIYQINQYPEYRDPLNDKEHQIIDLFDIWNKSDYRKVVLKADDKEFEKVKQHFFSCSSSDPYLDMVLVKDNGLTEISAGSETVIGLFPMKKSDCPKVVKKLQLLK
jgi:peptidyl-tRNA hydrolase